MTLDEHDIAQLMTRFFTAVSFDEGQRPNYDELHALFLPGGRLIRTGVAGVEVTTVDEFIEPRRATVESGALACFEEIELAARLERFAGVAHRFSTYRKRARTTGGEVDARGAITTQFVKTGAGWRISSMAWEDERPGVSLPARYRPA